MNDYYHLKDTGMHRAVEWKLEMSPSYTMCDWKRCVQSSMNQRLSKLMTGQCVADWFFCGKSHLGPSRHWPCFLKPCFAFAVSKCQLCITCSQQKRQEWLGSMTSLGLWLRLQPWMSQKNVEIWPQNPNCQFSKVYWNLSYRCMEVCFQKQFPLAQPAPSNPSSPRNGQWKDLFQIAETWGQLYFYTISCI